MSNVCVFAADGFEEIEGLMVVDLLRRAQIAVTLVSITGDTSVTGRSHIEIKADCLFEEINNFDDVDMLVLPGGMPGTTNLDEFRPLKELIRIFCQQGKKVAAICAAPTILGKMGLLEGKEATCYPGLEEQLRGAIRTDKEVVVDGNIITSRGLGTSIVFSLRLIEQLLGAEAAQQVRESIVFHNNEVQSL